MTNAQRQAYRRSIFSNLVWTGANVTTDVPNVLSFGHSHREDQFTGSNRWRLSSLGLPLFGPPISAPALPLPVVLVNDGVGTPRTAVRRSRRVR